MRSPPPALKLVCKITFEIGMTEPMLAARSQGATQRKDGRVKKHRQDERGDESLRMSMLRKRTGTSDFSAQIC